MWALGTLLQRRFVYSNILIRLFLTMETLNWAQTKNRMLDGDFVIQYQGQD